EVLGNLTASAAAGGAGFRPLAGCFAAGDCSPNIEVALVDPGLLDGRDDAANALPDVPRVLAVDRVARADEDCLRAAAQRLCAAHGGVDSEASRDVVRGCDDSTAARIAAHDERLGAEFRVLELLHASVERVEIQVRDDHANKCTGRRRRRRPNASDHAAVVGGASGASGVPLSRRSTLRSGRATRRYASPTTAMRNI